MAGRKPMPLGVSKKNYTKAEIEQKQQKEKKLEDFEPISETPPSYLSTNAKKEYKRVHQLLSRLPVSQLDQQILVQYCELFSDYRDITDEITEIKKMLKKGYDIALDKQLVSKRRQRIEVFREIKSTGNLLGMSMESRMKLVPSETDEIDPLAEMFGDE